ncbi:MAG: glucosyltransferase domain-containing protein [Lachnospiraceae bacterium]|nr:glucosyltransferase domain-containing protein [Lachnospiraceae bacterium]
MTREKRVFVYTIIIGFLTHAFRMTNTMICSDTTNYLKSIGVSWVISLGRIFLPTVEKIRGTVELPFLIGTISLIMIGCAAVFFVRLFDIQENIFLVIVVWILVANPVVTSIFAYMYTADGYMISLLFSVLAAYLCLKKKGLAGTLLGGLCLAVSLGFYQAFISVTIIIMLFFLFRMLYTSEYDIKDIGKMAGRCLLSGVTGVAIYVIGTLIVWKVGGHQAAGYMGMDSAGGTGIHGLLQAVVDCYVDFARFYIVRWELNRYNAMNVLMFILTLITWLVLVTKRKLWRMPARVALMALVFPLLPFVCHIFEFASAGVSYTSTSMEYSLALIYLLLLIMWSDMRFSVSTQNANIEKPEDSKDAADFAERFRWTDLQYWKRHYLSMLSVVLLLCISFHFTVIANRSYYNMNNANTKMEMLLNRLVMRMEMTEGYHEDMAVAIYGSCYQTPEYVPAAPVMSGVVSNIFLTRDNEYISMMNHYLSTSYRRADFETMCQIAATEEFAMMESWPSESSIKIINETMVLYLSDTDVDRYLPQEEGEE